MKIYFPRLISLLAIATALTLTSCGGGGGDDPKPTPDTEKPAITVTTPAATGQTYGLGGVFQFDGTFTDNVELKNVVFSLKDNKPAPSASLKAATGVDDAAWEPTDETVEIPAGKKSHPLNKELFGGIPSTDIWTGVYTLTITCTDKEGNSTEKIIDVNIQ